MKLVGGFKYFFIFTPIFGKINDPIWRIRIFQTGEGLVKSAEKLRPFPQPRPKGLLVARATQLAKCGIHSGRASRLMQAVLRGWSQIVAHGKPGESNGFFSPKKASG